jgi:uncharacterized protein YdeI (YjbR/CyaY-like superfamily)
MAGPDAAAILEFPDAAAWDAWLALHGEEAPETWLRIGKKGGCGGLIRIADAGDVAICHGWIDSLRRSFDPDSFLQRYSPRRTGAPWSLVNARRAEALDTAGRMRPGGRREMDEARADGRWAAAYAPQGEAEVPADLAAALGRDSAARSAFDSLCKSARYLLMLPILKAASPETRAKRIGKAVAELRAETGSMHRTARESY